MTPHAAKQPTVDVLIPVRAPAPWLSEALDSVLLQSRSCGLIVVMDGPSEEVASSCEAVASRIDLTLAKVPEDSGIVAALNHGLRLSSADYIARLDADDRCHPRRIERQVEYLMGHPHCVAVGTHTIPIDTTGRPLGMAETSVSPPEVTGRSVMPRLRWRTPLAHPSVMLNRRAALEVGGYSPFAQHIEDFDLWLRMAAKPAQIDVIPEPLLDYRHHPDQVTARTQFSKGARQRILQSRLEMARGRGESQLAARLRHMVWTSYHRIKGR